MGTLSGKIASSGLTPVYVNSAVNASAGKLYQCDTTSAAFTVTLPTGSTGSVLRFVDDAGTWGTHNLTIAPAATQTIQGISGNGSLVCDLSGAYVEMTWDATNSQWCVQTTGFQYGPNYVPDAKAGLVASAGLLGHTNGSAVAAGNVGQVIASGELGAGINVGVSVTSLGSISVPAGVWMLVGQAGYDNYNSATTNVYWEMGVQTSIAMGGTIGVDWMIASVNTGNSVGAPMCLVKFVSISSTTTYYLTALANATSAGVSGIEGTLTAVRIA